MIKSLVCDIDHKMALCLREEGLNFYMFFQL